MKIRRMLYERRKGEVLAGPLGRKLLETNEKPSLPIYPLPWNPWGGSQQRPTPKPCNFLSKDPQSTHKYVSRYSKDEPAQ